MCRRVVGSSAPNGSSMRMIRGERISVRAIATRCRMPPDSSLGYFMASRLTSRPTFAIHSRACSRRSFAGNAPALEAERHVVFDGAVVERGVVLKHHAAIGTGLLDAAAADEHVPSVGGWCGRSPAINRSTVDFPQPDGPEDGDEFALFADPARRRSRRARSSDRRTAS